MRTVTKGFTQVIGEDYEETYTSVARLKLVRLVCAVVAVRNLCLWQVDFVLVFLDSDNAFEVYIVRGPLTYDLGAPPHCLPT